MVSERILTSLSHLHARTRRYGLDPGLWQVVDFAPLEADLADVVALASNHADLWPIVARPWFGKAATSTATVASLGGPGLVDLELRTSTGCEPVEVKGHGTAANQRGDGTWQADDYERTYRGRARVGHYLSADGDRAGDVAGLASQTFWRQRDLSAAVPGLLAVAARTRDPNTAAIALIAATVVTASLLTGHEHRARYLAAIAGHPALPTAVARARADGVWAPGWAAHLARLATTRSRWRLAGSVAATMPSATVTHDGHWAQIRAQVGNAAIRAGIATDSDGTHRFVAYPVTSPRKPAAQRRRLINAGFTITDDDRVLATGCRSAAVVTADVDGPGDFADLARRVLAAVS